MSTETERKFLVKGDFKRYATGSINITQGYLSVDPMKTIRIRITDDSGYITIKSPRKTGVIARGEWEFPIPVNDAEELMALCIPGRIKKTRYIVPSGRNKFEVDVFHDKNEGLIIAEIELESESEIFERPEWLGDEVTGDPRYYNSMLIK